MLSLAFHKKTSEKDYCIIGTIDEANYSEGATDLKNSKFFEHLHLFKEKWNFEIMPRHVWVPNKKCIGMLNLSNLK